ncbi:MAG TPA: hypothetical protein VMU39_24205 [Solirubrobacteraceae bacterium]|nr:hypothetical protein [Solirubrobacteraceae bacterium]
MTVTAIEAPVRASGDRRSYQREVEHLLEQIRGQVRDIRALKVAGVRGAAFKERKERLEQTRGRLQSVISASTRTAQTV